MKQLLLIITFFTLSHDVVFGQETIARLKYEDAEEAFTKNDFATTLTKLSEAEKLLGKSNPRILYLRIMAQNGQLKANPKYTYAELDALRKNANNYLTLYEKTEGIEDKYRQVYRVSENLSSYPATEQAYNAIKATEYKKVMAPILAINRFADSLSAIYKFKRGMTEADLKAAMPDVNDKNYVTQAPIDPNQLARMGSLLSMLAQAPGAANGKPTIGGVSVSSADVQTSIKNAAELTIVQRKGNVGSKQSSDVGLVTYKLNKKQQVVTCIFMIPYEDMFYISTQMGTFPEEYRSKIGGDITKLKVPDPADPDKVNYVIATYQGPKKRGMVEITGFFPSEPESATK